MSFNYILSNCCGDFVEKNHSSRLHIDDLDVAALRDAAFFGREHWRKKIKRRENHAADDPEKNYCATVLLDLP